MRTKPEKPSERRREREGEQMCASLWLAHHSENTPVQLLNVQHKERRAGGQKKNLSTSFTFKLCVADCLTQPLKRGKKQKRVKHATSLARGRNAAAARVRERESDNDKSRRRGPPRTIGTIICFLSCVNSVTVGGGRLASSAPRFFQHQEEGGETSPSPQSAR